MATKSPTITDAALEVKTDGLIKDAQSGFVSTPFIASGPATQELVTIFDAAYDAGRKPVIVRGLPGGGKSAFIEAWAESRDFNFIVLILSQMDPTDLGGYLQVVQDEATGESYTANTEPSWLRRARLADRPTVILFDEYGNAAPSLKAASLTILQEKRVGQFKLPENSTIVLAMNEVADGEDGYTMGAPSANRMLHLEYETDFNDWVEGMLVAFNKYELSATEAEERLYFTKFLEGANSNWYAKPESDEKAGHAWPSPRSWDNAASVCARVVGNNVVHQRILAGYVGQSAADEYARWRKSLRLPEYSVVMSNPTRLQWEGFKADEVYFILQNVVSRITGENIKKSADVFAAAAEQGVTDVATALVDDLCVRAAELAKKGLLERREVFGLLKQLAPISAEAGIAG